MSGMVTNFLDNFAARAMATPAADNARGLFSRAIGAVQHMVCSLHGHDNLLHFDQNRMYLRCSSCGHETPGWAIDDTRPRLRFHGDAQRQILAVQPSLIERRKIA
jgi:hypothetical protein